MIIEEKYGYVQERQEAEVEDLISTRETSRVCTELVARTSRLSSKSPSLKVMLGL